MKVSVNFDSTEFDCRNGEKYPKDWIKPRLLPLCRQLEKIRALTGQPIKIISGYRTKAYNAKIKGAAKASQHIEGIAADIMLKGMTALQLYKAICKLIADGVILEGGCGLYNTHCHYDIRSKKARWNKSKWKLG